MNRTIAKDCAGLSVKEYLEKEIPGLSRRILIALKKKENGITVNGERVTVRFILREGDVLALDLEDSAASDIPPCESVPQILFEDDDVVVVNKPEGMPTHPSLGHYGDSLANVLVYYYRQKQRPFVFRSLNRLDSVTSGVVVVAKNQLSAARLGKALMRGDFLKRYYALVEGEIKHDIGIITANIKRALPSIILRTVCRDDEGECAVTTWRVLQRFNGYTLLEVFPHTGRTHQIRVHLAYISHPIVGDFLYGKEGQGVFDSVALHCAVMSFPHPTTSERMEITAPLPDRMKAMIRAITNGQISGEDTV